MGCQQRAHSVYLWNRKSGQHDDFLWQQLSHTSQLSDSRSFHFDHYNCTGGVVITATDLNGNTTTTNYTDPNYWRPASVVAPYLSNTSTTTTGFSYTSTTVDAQMLFNGSNSVVEQLTTYGGFGQPLYSQQREGPNSGNWDTTQTNYDSLLRPYQSTMPCVASSGNGCPSAAVTTRTFDALGRVQGVTNGGSPAGYVNYTYTLNDILQVVGPAATGEKEAEAVG